MQKTLLSIGLSLLTWSLVLSQAATPKPTNASGNAASTQPTGAGALTGTSGAGSRLNPAGAGALIEKWQTFKAPGIELALPENYRGGSPHTNGLQALIKGIRLLGADYEQMPAW